MESGSDQIMIFLTLFFDKRESNIPIVWKNEGMGVNTVSLTILLCKKVL